MKRALLASVVGLLWTLPGAGWGRPAMAQSFNKTNWVVQINHVRLQNGGIPVAYSTILEHAAQRQTEDMASHRSVQEVGTDGSDTGKRTADAGYGAWAGRRVVAESLVVASRFEDALDIIVGEPQQLKLLLSPRVREVGIGATQIGNQIYFSILFGAQPNVLPLFLNDGAAVTQDTSVAVRFSQEDISPNSDPGNSTIGKVTDMRLSTRSDFVGADWQPFERLIAFSLENTPGIQTVYAQFRDALGHVAESSSKIMFDPNAIAPTPEGLGARFVNPGAVPDVGSASIESDTLLAPGRIITDSGTAIPVFAVRTVLARTTPSRATAATPTPTVASGATATPFYVEATVAPEAPVPTRVVLPMYTTSASTNGQPSGINPLDSLLATPLPWIFGIQGALAVVGLIFFLRLNRHV